MKTTATQTTPRTPHWTREDGTEFWIFVDESIVAGQPATFTLADELGDSEYSLGTNPRRTIMGNLDWWTKHYPEVVEFVAGDSLRLQKIFKVDEE